MAIAILRWELIRDLATDIEKRKIFTRLAAHLSTLADEMEAAIAAKMTSEK